jgi:two-component system, chemotaxis family, CheB/CheR fusion protein
VNAAKESTFPIIGIGASAGGLNPFITILEALPAELPAAIIFIQHFPADQKSLLPEILGKKFPSRHIFEIAHGMAIDKGKVYVNPSDHDITIESGRFRAKPRPKTGIHLPIDTFFYSLVEDERDNAVVVILSGAGTDGSRGVREVQCKGGAVLVQDPATAEAPGMPDAAIEAGNIDEVLTPENIARHIVSLVKTFAQLHRSPVLQEQDSLNALFNRLHEKAGFRFEDYKKTVVARRAHRRMLLHGLTSIDEYLEFLDKTPLEINRLALDLMIGVTGFFRDRAAWDNLKQDIVHEMIARKSGGDSLRVWTPGCSTGEEPYSIAMMLLHEIEAAKLRSDVQVFATDINEAALTIARNGKYPGGAAADIPAHYLKAYFTSTEDGSRILINKYVRDHVVFAKQNILEDAPFSKLYLIICRNLLIYLDPAAQDRCLSVFHYALKEDGFLFLGNAESLGHKKAFFKSIGEKKQRLYKRVTQAKAVHYNFPVTVGLKTSPSAAEDVPASKNTNNRIDFAREQLLTLFAPAAVLIDNRYEILYFNDPVKRFIDPPAGRPSFDFLAWLPEQMRNRIRGAIYNASQTAEPVSVVLSLPDANKQERMVTLTVRLFKDPLDQFDTFLIVFSDQTAPGSLQASTLQCSEAEQAAIQQLERELTDTRNELQINGEEMKSANEELQSSNEELQAANEEMETSREELQSLNEELTTINGQLQTTVEVQESLNNDLSNFFSSTNIPTLFLDHEFKVRRFTPAMTRLIKLIPSDIGRPLADMSLEYLGAGALADARTVLANLATIKKEITIGEGFYERSTLPYRTVDNRIEGVVICFIDITERKRAEEKLRESLQQNQFLASVIESSSQPFGVGYPDGRTGLINKAFEQLTGYSGDELHTIDWASKLTPPEWFEIERKKLEELNRTGRPVRYEKEYIRKDGTCVPIELLVHLEKDPEGKPLYYYSFLTDISERKRAEEALRESEQHFRLLFETMLQGAVYQDARGTVISMNRAAERILGKTQAEFLGSSSLQEEHGTIREDGSPFPGPEHPAMVSLQTGKAVSNTVMGVYNRRIGGYRWISIDAVPLFRPGENKPFQVYTVFSDITASKQAEDALKAANKELHDSRRAALNLTKDAVAARQQTELANAALRASEAQLRSILDATQESIWVFSPEGTILLGNPTALARMGMNLQGVIGKRFDEILPPNLAQTRMKILREVANSGRQQVFEDERAGIYFQHTFYPMFDDTGRVMSVVSFSRDVTERKRADEELKTSELKYRRLFEAAKDGILILDFETGLIVDVNKYLADMLEYSHQEFLNKRLWDIGVFKDVAASKEAFAELRNKEFIRYEYLPLQTKNGKKRAVEFVSNVYLVDHKKVIQCNIRDITERKIAEDALKENRTLLKTIIDSTLDHISLKDNEGRYVIVNSAAAASLKGGTGFAAKDIIGKKDGDIFPAEDAARIMEMDRKIISSGETLTFDQSFTISGERRTFSTVKSPSRGLDGSIAGVVSLSRDITERKQREIELDKLNRTLKVLSKSSQAMALATNELEYLSQVCSIIVQDSGYAMVWIGYAEDENKSVRPVAYSGFEQGYLETLQLTWADTERGRGPTGTAIRTGKISICKNILTDPAFGPWREEALKRGYASSIVLPLLAEGKAFGAINIYSSLPDPFTEGEIGLLSDLASDLAHGIMAIRLRQKIEELNGFLKHRADELAAANKELESFSYSVSHDLRAPLRAMKGFGSILLEDYANKLDGDGRDFLKRIVSSSDKMSGIIDDMLSLAKISRQEMNRVEINLTSIAGSIAEELRHAEPERNVNVLIAEDLKAHGDARLMKIALSNMLGNAWKYSKKTPDAEIEFAVKENNGERVYYVRDNGAGFDMAQAHRLFSPFQRLHSESQFPGTGIGLAIVNRVIQRHGGRIWAESKVGKGAAFYFTIGKTGGGRG